MWFQFNESQLNRQLTTTSHHERERVIEKQRMEIEKLTQLNHSFQEEKVVFNNRMTG
jgi:hypothetical protein